MGERCKLPPAGFGAETQPKSILVHFSLYVWHLVATILMIFVKTNCANFSRLVWRPPYLRYRFRRRWWHESWQQWNQCVFIVNYVVAMLQFMNQREFGVPDVYCDAVMHCKDGAGVLLLQILYQLLTSRQWVSPASFISFYTLPQKVYLFIFVIFVDRF